MVSFTWKGFDNEIKEKDFADGFHIYLTLKNLKINTYSFQMRLVMMLI